MHLLADDAPPSETYDRIVRVRRRPRWLDRVRALLVRVFARKLNYRDHASGWRVTFDGLERGHTGLVCSVLFEPFAEIDLDELPQSDPEGGYFADLIEHLEAAQSTGRMAFVHCVKGGFHLRRTQESITANVAELARRGVGYVTLAHLFYRRIATNAPRCRCSPTRCTTASSASRAAWA